MRCAQPPAGHAIARHAAKSRKYDLSPICVELVHGCEYIGVVSIVGGNPQAQSHGACDLCVGFESVRVAYLGSAACIIARAARFCWKRPAKPLFRRRKEQCDFVPGRRPTALVTRLILATSS